MKGRTRDQVQLKAAFTIAHDLVMSAFTVYLGYLFVCSLIVGLALGAYGNRGLKGCVLDTCGALRRHTDPVNGWSLGLIKHDSAFIHTLSLSLAYACVLLIATFSLELKLGLTPSTFAEVDDDVFKRAGPLFPFVILLAQAIILPYSYLEQEGVVRGHHTYKCLPASWTLSILIVWLVMAVLRAVTYGFIKGTHENDYCSDHVWLSTFMIGCLQMKLYVVHVSGKKLGFGCRTVPLCILCWATVIFTMTVSWVTVRYYHTVQAIWTAYFLGTIFFSGIAFWWIGVLRSQGFQELSLYDDGSLEERKVSLLNKDVACNGSNNETNDTLTDNTVSA